jgi:hypothetical protein
VVKKRFYCPRCNEWHVLEVLEPGEAQVRRVHPIAVRCPECGGPLLPEEVR